MDDDVADDGLAELRVAASVADLHPLLVTRRLADAAPGTMRDGAEIHYSDILVDGTEDTQILPDTVAVGIVEVLGAR